ncbi:hypothetical protein NFI96_026226 [Prochilodus magdalenae]|nr:hypothetical protein NFI96_026226 [Prochilodus magdalenae]
MRSLLLLSLIHLAASDSTLSRKAICTKTEDSVPAEWFKVHESIPSALHDLDLKLNLNNGPTASPSFNISWSINIDSTIQYITGTWIQLGPLYHSAGSVKYRCDYQPPFTLKTDHYTGLEQYSFSFTSTDVDIKPANIYEASAFNLPPALSDTSGKYIKYKSIEVPGCHNEQMSTHSACLSEDMDVNVVSLWDEVVVNFISSSEPEEYKIILQRHDDELNRTTVNTNGRERISVRLNIPGPCENLTVLVCIYPLLCISHNRVLKKLLYLQIWRTNCLDCVDEWVEKSIDCTEPQPVKQNGTSLLIATACAVATAVLLILICLWQLCRLSRGSGFSRCGLTSVSTGLVEVLVVYPAVNSVFQQAVMALADFLQSHTGLNIVIDMWQRSSLAKQGPLRWLNSQADRADKVLIVLPPQHTYAVSSNTVCRKQAAVSGMPDYTVPASAHELFSLALNLVASSAHDPQCQKKFWVVQLGQGGERSSVPMELRGCKTFSLPKDLEKLHKKLASRKGQKCSGLRGWMWSFNWREASKKVRDALLQLDRSQQNCSKEEMVHLTYMIPDSDDKTTGQKLLTCA